MGGGGQERGAAHRPRRPQLPVAVDVLDESHLGGIVGPPPRPQHPSVTPIPLAIPLRQLSKQLLNDVIAAYYRCSLSPRVQRTLGGGKGGRRETGSGGGGKA